MSTLLVRILGHRFNFPAVIVFPHSSDCAVLPETIQQYGAVDCAGSLVSSFSYSNITNRSTSILNPTSYMEFYNSVNTSTLEADSQQDLS